MNFDTIGGFLILLGYLAIFGFAAIFGFVVISEIVHSFFPDVSDSRIATYIVMGLGAYMCSDK